MRLNISQLDLSVVYKLGQVNSVLLFGNNEQLMLETIQDINAMVEYCNENEFLHKAQQQISLFAQIEENRIVTVIRDVSEKFIKECEKLIQSKKKLSNNDDLVILLSTTVRNGHKIVTTFTKESNLLCVPVYDLNGAEMRSLLKKKIKSRNLQITDEALSDLSVLCGDYLLTEKLLKLELYCNQLMIDADAVTQCLWNAQGIDHNFMNSILNHDNKVVVKYLLNAQDTHPLVVIRGLIKFFIQLWHAKLNPDEAKRISANIFYKNLPLFKSLSHKLSNEQIYKTLDKLANMEIIIKREQISQSTANPLFVDFMS